MADAFEEAARRRPDEVVVSSIGSPAGPIRLRVVGRQLAGHLSASLGHVAAPDQPPALRVDMWDEAVAGVPCPVPTVHSAFPRDVNGTLVRLDPRRPGTMWTAGHGSVTELDRDNARMVGWRADGSRLSIEERARPFPVALQTWLQSRGVVTVHAAAVACEGRAALIVGESGSGKSTTALVCTASGFGFLGDDQIAVSDPDGCPVAHSLFASARVDEIVHRVQPGVSHAVHPAPNGAGKSLVLLSGPGTPVVPSAAVAALIVVTVSPRDDSTIDRATAKDALRALLPSTMLGVVDDQPTVFRACTRIVLGRRTYRLTSGHNLETVPRLVAQALSEGR